MVGKQTNSSSVHVMRICKIALIDERFILNGQDSVDPFVKDQQRTVDLNLSGVIPLNVGQLISRSKASIHFFLIS